MFLGINHPNVVSILLVRDFHRLSKVSSLEVLQNSGYPIFKNLTPGSPELQHYQVDEEDFEDFFKQRNDKMRRSGSHE